MILSRALFIVMFLNMSLAVNAQVMDEEQLDIILTKASDTIRHYDNVWEFIVDDVLMMCIIDKPNNRMRIVAPIREMKEVSTDEVNDAMEANFHSALDIRYCISDNLMWAAFIHPFRELTDGQVKDAVRQVYAATNNFGTSYSSSHLAFPKGENTDDISKKRF